MKTILNQLYLPYLSKLGFFPSDIPHNSKRCGIYYELDPLIGTGFFWVYPVDNLYAISIFNLTFKSDFYFQYEHPPFVCLGNYETSNAELLLKNKNGHMQSLIGYVGNNDIFHQTINVNTKICNVGICFTPEFYQKFLPNKYSIDLQSMLNIFSKFDGNNSVPEITLVLNQIRSFQPSNDIARIYYESKVMELISLVMQWGKNQLSFNDNDNIPDWEIEKLSIVENYLNQNYTNTVSLDTLSKIACMSHNKLTNTFKQVYNSTITEYIQSLRINKAKELLICSDIKIGEISNKVGYKLHGSFSEMFKQATGFTPKEYRKKQF